MRTTTTFGHRPALCTSCGIRYKTLDALTQHNCADVPSWMAREALRAMAPFVITSETEARTMIQMWARRSELTDADIEYVVTEAVK